MKVVRKPWNSEWTLGGTLSLQEINPPGCILKFYLDPFHLSANCSGNKLYVLFARYFMKDIRLSNSFFMTLIDLELHNPFNETWHW